LLALGGFSVALPASSTSVVALHEDPPANPPAAPDLLQEHRDVAQVARERTIQAASEKAEQEVRLRAEQAAEAQRKAAAEAQAQAEAQAEAAQQQAQAAQQQAEQQAQTAVAAAPAPAQPQAPAPAPVPTAFIPVVGAGGQAAVDACAGPVRFTPVTVSISIAEHDFCGGWSRMSWIQPGTVVTVQGYGTYTAFQRMVVAQGVGQSVLAGFAGGYPPIFLQTCIPGTSQMLLIALH
jgi:hypothetical protein